ncbi:MAG: hypothetical protein QOJ46_2023 [bacterium]|jgi:hypothetical protein
MALLRSSLLLVLLALVAAGPALADHGGGGGDARVSGRCSKGTSSQLRLSSHGNEIRVEFEVKRRRAGESWRVVFIHERRVAWRGTVRTTSNGSFRVRRSYDDYEGADNVTARASGPRGLTCQASATLSD